MSQEVIKFIYERCKHYRWTGKNTEAFEMFKCYAKLCDISLDKLKVVPSDPNTFIRMMEELNIYAYYTEARPYGNIISDRLLLSTYSGINRHQVIINQIFYMEKVPRINRHRIYAKAEINYVNLNASILKVEDGYILNARTVNYELTDKGDYIIKTKDSFVNTINYILYMNKEYVVEKQHKLVDKSVCQEYGSSVRGLEDIIIFYAGDSLWCTCTCRDTNPGEMPQMCLCKISDTPNYDSEFEVMIKRPIYLIHDQRPEKNWLPFYDIISTVIPDIRTSDSLLTEESEVPLLDKGPFGYLLDVPMIDRQIPSFNFIYSYNPFIIRSIKHDKNVIDELGFISSEVKTTVNIPDFDMGRFRGSAGPLKFDGGYLFVVHEVIFLDGIKRNYTHRFVFTDKEFHIVKLSFPYYFEEPSVEFCRSMCWSHDENQIILTVGRKDSESWIYILHETMVKEMLYDINFFKF